MKPWAGWVEAGADNVVRLRINPTQIVADQRLSARLNTTGKRDHPYHPSLRGGSRGGPKPGPMAPDIDSSLFRLWRRAFQNYVQRY